MMEDAQAQLTSLEEADGEAARALVATIDSCQAQIAHHNGDSRSADLHPVIEDAVESVVDDEHIMDDVCVASVQDITTFVFNLHRRRDPPPLPTAAPEPMTMRACIDMAKLVESAEATYAAVLTLRARLPLLTQLFFHTPRECDLTQLGPLTLQLTALSLKRTTQFLDSVLAAAGASSQEWGPIQHDMDNELATFARLNTPTIIFAPDPVEKYLSLAPAAPLLLSYLLSKAAVNKIPAELQDLYDHMASLSFVQDGELTLTKTWEAYRALSSKVEASGTPIKPRRVFVPLVDALGHISSSGTSTKGVPKAAPLASDLMILGIPVSSTTSFDTFTYECVMTTSTRDSDDDVPAEMLQSLTDCLHRYQSPTAAFTAALDVPRPGALNAMRVMGGGGGGGGGRPGPDRFDRFGHYPCPTCQQRIPSISGFCVPCALATPGAWTCSCARIINASHARCTMCNAPRTSANPTAADIATNIARVRQAQQRN